MDAGLVWTFIWGAVNILVAVVLYWLDHRDPQK